MPEDFQIEDYSEPDEKFEIEDLETLKVMADPQRLRILEELIEGPQTVKQIASALETTPTKLYYHFKMMEEHGLIRVVATRVVSGIIEKLYHVRAYSYPLNKSLLALAETTTEEGFPTIISSVLDHTSQEIKRGFRSGLIDPRKSDKEHRNFILLRTLGKLSPDKATEFINRFEALITEFNDCGEEQTDDPEAQVYGLMVTCYPTHHVNLPSMKPKKEEETKGEGNG